MARGHIRPARTQAGATGQAWELVIDLPRDEWGRRRQQWATVHGSRREAERELTRLLREVDTGALTSGGAVLVRDYLEHWIENCAKLDLAPQSYHQYRCAVNLWQRAIGRHRMDRLSPLHIQAACKQAQDTGLAPATVRRYHATLHRALRQAVEWGVIARNPSDHIALPRGTHQEMRALTAEEAIRLLEVAREHPSGILVVLALGLGLRAGECLGLQWRDLDGEYGVATIARSVQHIGRGYKEPKGGRARGVSIPEFVRLALQERQEVHQQRAALFGPAWNPDGLIYSSLAGGPAQPHTTQLMRRLCKLAGIAPAIRFHDLRHTHATLLLSQGADVKAVSQRLGHADIRITLQVYHHVLPGVEQEMVRKLDCSLK